MTADASTRSPRVLSARLWMEVADPTAFVLAVAPARPTAVVDERLEITLDGDRVAFRELQDAHGTRLQLFEAGSGRLEVRYGGTVQGAIAPAPVEPIDSVIYLRPSRYCESDAMVPFARERFGALAGLELLRAVPEWVHRHLSYVPGSSSPTDGAQDTLDRAEGVCRDYAHLVITLFRALDVPARLVAVYAPGLEPMDFHAVVEVLVDGRWYVVDATRLAPRSSMVRIATGRDAADTAFLTNTLADITFGGLEVDARKPNAGADDPDELVQLG